MAAAGSASDITPIMVVPRLRKPCGFCPPPADAPAPAPADTGNLAYIKVVERECNKLLAAWEHDFKTRNDAFVALVEKLTDHYRATAEAARHGQVRGAQTHGIELHHPEMEQFCADLKAEANRVHFEHPIHWTTLTAWFSEVQNKCETFRKYTGKWHTFEDEAIFFSKLLKDIGSVWEGYSVTHTIDTRSVGRLLVNGARAATLPCEVAYKLMTLVGYHERGFELLAAGSTVCTTVVSAALPEERSALMALMKLVYVYSNHSSEAFDELMASSTT